jgi:hypothetical protein
MLGLIFRHTHVYKYLELTEVFQVTLKSSGDIVVSVPSSATSWEKNHRTHCSMQSAPNTNVPEIFQSEFLWLIQCIYTNV